MAYDKIVDSEKLDGAIKATADAIREIMTDGSPLPLEWMQENGFNGAIIGLGSNRLQKEYNRGHEEGYSSGKQAEHDDFWDIYQENGTRTGYGMAFGGYGWTKDTFKPKYNMTVGDGYMMFRYHNASNEPYDLAEHLEKLGVTLKLDYSTQYMFAYANVSRIPELDFTVGTRAMQLTFNGCSAVVTIDKIKVNPNTTYEAAFNGASSLKHIVIEGTIASEGLNLQWSPLDKESLTSIISALSTTTSVKRTVTLSKNAVNKAFETRVGANDGEFSTEWANLIAPYLGKWNISLANA